MQLIDRVGRKSWSDEQVRKYVGEFAGVYFTYARDEAFRQRSASGGSTTALLVHLLETGQIEGALVVYTEIVDGLVVAKLKIATTRAELLAAQGSKYSPVRFGTEEIEGLVNYPGRLAAVLLPCDALKLMRARKREKVLDDKMVLVIALVCGHNSEAELTKLITDRMGSGHGALRDFHYRSGHWRGEMTATFEDGAVVKQPFGRFSDYRNLYFYAQTKCNHCFDHYGYYCDISAGDIWSLSMRKDPIKHTALLTRSAAGERVLAEAVAAGKIVSERQDVREIMDGQSRTMPFHYNVSARAAVAPRFGIKMKDPVQERVRPVDYVVAYLALLNQWISGSPTGRRILNVVPRPVVRFYLYCFKALELI